jgi:hypothetical protein
MQVSWPDGRSADAVWQGLARFTEPDNDHMVELRDMVTLDQAAGELGTTAIALFAHAARGITWAGLVGEVGITTRQDVERYRRDRLHPVALQ